MGLPPRYGIDLRDLEVRYRELSRVLHPDKHAQKPAGERRLSLGKAVEVNEAYRALKDDLSRATALLALRGHVVSEGEGAPSDPMFLMEVMELREELSEARAAKDLDRVGALGEKVAEMRRTTTREMAEAFDGDGDDARAAGTEEQDQALMALVGRLRYYRRFMDEVDVIEEEAMG